MPVGGPVTLSAWATGEPDLELRTARLLLRDLRADDAAALNAVEREPGVTRYMSFDRPSLDETAEYLRECVLDQQATPRLTFDLAIVASENPDRLIGRCGLGIRRPEHHEAELWYLLAPDVHGQGYATEATAATLDLAFGPFALHRVWADCDPRNDPACRLARRLGMRHEGTLRENYRLRGEWCSSNIFGILAHEWRGVSR